MSVVSPSHFDFVSAESLRAEGFCKRGQLAAGEHERAGLCDHGAVVDAEAVVGGVEFGVALSRHRRHHLLKSQVAADAADNQHLARAGVRHCSLGRLDQHRKDGLLQRKTQVFFAVFARRQPLCGSLLKAVKKASINF